MNDFESSLLAAAEHVTHERGQWYSRIAEDPEFQSLGGVVYPYDTLGANLQPVVTLLRHAGWLDSLSAARTPKIIDIGCANGELSFALAIANSEVTALDFSFKHDQAPFIVSRIAGWESIPLSVVDLSVDGYFSMADIHDRVVKGSAPVGDFLKYDLAISVGLLYHLRNPIAFLESLKGLAYRILVGTHTMTHTPGFRTRIDAEPLAYLVESGELNHDPTNFWIFTPASFKRLARRAGLEVVGELSIPNNELGFSVPDQVQYGVRTFLALQEAQ